MALGVVGTDLYTHIKHMSYTTGLSCALTLVIEIVLFFLRWRPTWSPGIRAVPTRH